jgi:organic hydroperoxide reductase OsmC/OhrA
MQIAATVTNTAQAHEVRVRTDANARRLAIDAKPSGRGSAVNGGEFLMLALATCYCNDLFREAARLGIAIDRVEVEATAQFDGIGLAARDVRYRASVTSAAGAERIAQLLRETDAVAEIHNTLRAGSAVTLVTD